MRCSSGDFCARLHPSRQEPKARITGEDHERADCRQSRHPPANPAPAASQARDDRVVAVPPLEAVRRLQARGRQGNPSRRHRHGRPQGPDRLVRRHRPAKPGGVSANGPRLPLPHLLHDQADRLGRHHDAGRGRTAPALRARREIHSGIRQAEGRRREQRQARSRRRAAADDGAGPAAPHLRHHLRPHRQQPGAADV